jgi:hypothetical protein
MGVTRSSSAHNTSSPLAAGSICVCCCDAKFGWTSIVRIIQIPGQCAPNCWIVPNSQFGPMVHDRPKSPASLGYEVGIRIDHMKRSDLFFVQIAMVSSRADAATQVDRWVLRCQRELPRVRQACVDRSGLRVTGFASLGSRTSCRRPSLPFRQSLLATARRTVRTDARRMQHRLGRLRTKELLYCRREAARLQGSGFILQVTALCAISKGKSLSLRPGATSIVSNDRKFWHCQLSPPCGVSLMRRTSCPLLVVLPA